MEEVKRVLIAGISLSTLLFVARYGARYVFEKKKHSSCWQAKDVFVLLGFIAYLTMIGIYYSASPDIFWFPGEPLSVERELSVNMKLFITGILFAINQWSIKFSQLLTSRQWLVSKRLYWHFVVGFTISLLLVVLMSNVIAWNEIGWFDQISKIGGRALSMSISTGADLVTDILVMSVPINQVWRLKVQFSIWLRLLASFLIECITMMFVIARVISLLQHVRDGEVDPIYIAIWDAITGLISIFIGCLLPISIYFRRSLTLVVVHLRDKWKLQRFSTEVDIESKGSIRPLDSKSTENFNMENMSSHTVGNLENDIYP